MSGECTPAGPAGYLPILTYHSLDDSASVLSTSPAVFAEHMRILYDQGVTTMSLAEAAKALQRGSLPARAVAITFDDGFRSAYELGLPVLARYGFTATVFLVTDYCERDNSWPTQPAGALRRPLLGWSEVRALSRAGLVIGAHTRTHPDLTRLSAREADAEMVGSKRAIEDEIQRPVDAFAYPYGCCNETVKNLASDHFTVACSTTLGFANSASDPLALERLDVYYVRSPALFRRVFAVEGRAYVRLRRLARDLRRWALARRFR
jgi:peptidoglycan/xylan/chitin deacetylase (PgdA/CDA1 family)